MKKISWVPMWCLVVFFLLVCLGRIEETEAVTCNPAELSPCMSSIISGTPPTKQCCDKAREQEPCFCQYIKDPDFGKIINNPNTKKAVEACGLKWPTCP